MNRARRRGMALIYMLAAIPLAIVITSASSVLIGKVLRVQRESAIRTVNTDNANRLIERMRADAAESNRAILLGDGAGVLFENIGSNGGVEYRIEFDAVTRRKTSGDHEPALEGTSRWLFKRCDIDLRLEPVSESQSVLWVLVDYRVELRKSVVDRQKLATAIRVGSGGDQ